MSDTFRILVTDDDEKSSITQTVWTLQEDGREKHIVWTYDLKRLAPFLRKEERED